MIVLDTTVISELMRPMPNQNVFHWIEDQPIQTLFTTVITQAEIFAGITQLPEGRRKADLTAGAHRMFREYLTGRVLIFGSQAALHYAAITNLRRRAGKPITPLDIQISAIASVAAAPVATRNVRDFEGSGIEVIDPWNAG